MQISKTARGSEESPMRKFHPYAVRAEQAGKKVYHLNIGQPDIATPPAFFEAVRSFSDPTVEYAPSAGIPPLLEAVARYYAKLNAPFTTDDILITTGGSEALLIAMTCTIDDGEEILIPEPFYPNYATFARQIGARIRPIPTTPESGYHYAEKELLEAAVTPRTRAILLTNPGNPCGTVLTREEMQLVVDFAKKYDLWLIADEVYREFVYDGKPLSTFAAFPDALDRLILIDSVSKRFSACGARIGALLSMNREFLANALKFCQSRLSVATLDQVAATALYTVDESYFTAVREEYNRRRDTVVSALRRIPGVICECPGGAFYLMAKLPVDDAEKFQIWLLEQFDDHGDTVMFAPGQCFYAGKNMGKSEIRIAYVLKQQDLERAMELLAKGLEAYHNAQN